MKERTEYDYVDYGCGFPVVLDRVIVREEAYGEIPLIDYDIFQRRVLELLVTKVSRLTGNEVRFIRQYFRYTLETFATLLKVSHPAVMKWEDHGDAPTSMSASTEILLRLIVQQRLESSGAKFIKTFRLLLEGVHDAAPSVSDATLRVSNVPLPPSSP